MKRIRKGDYIEYDDICSAVRYGAVVRCYRGSQRGFRECKSVARGPATYVDVKSGVSVYMIRTTKIREVL